MRPGSLAAATAVAATALLATAAPALASYDVIGSGQAKLSLDGGFARLLKQNGIKLTGRKSAKVSGPVATLKTAGGKADPTIAKAEVALAGELILSKGGKNVAFKDITLKTKPTPIFAKVAGGQLKVAKASKVTLPRDGFGNDLLATNLKLTEKVATRLDKKLGVDAFAEGQKLGSLKATTQPQTVAVEQTGILTLSLDPAVYNRLTADSVAVNPIFPAEHQGPVFTFPIEKGGALAPDGKGGTLRVAGSMELLRLGAGQLFWKEPWLEFGGAAVSSEEDLEPAPTFPGKLGRVPFVDLAGGSFSTEPTARTMTAAGVALTLQAKTAAFFNQGFAEGKEEFHAGEPLGTVTFTAQTQ